ncbi:exopolyphosphatase/guanosine-5'-triphosphate,3'-diphosphate pyrophosphatase [Amycolatopsis lexingtonensis]|uniref:Exopolyphosphatase/guanosine-5'-triphosphate, 3'-diphosphate pyrophosphatase n=2 Tax=Amycolatopsis lexingtonensis TaxID=218822 RepID=A0ABR9HZW1_9PSEU|nr:exopolyphosphatase/guanosine-5'-triphosphate,3'-diphosphate pyrophosphatase [Amycolatopsis lexingtonensis]
MRKIEEPAVGVLDVGSFSARLVVVPVSGSPREPVLNHQTRLRLDRELDGRGRLTDRGVVAVTTAVAAGMSTAYRHGVHGVYPLATSSIRDAANAADVVRHVAGETGVELRFLSGPAEAGLAYLAARRWYGADAGPLLVLDIGGGTVELAAGCGEQATFARSLPLGARSMTRDWLPSERVSNKQVKALRTHALDVVSTTLGAAGVDDPRVVGCSKVLQQLARLSGARPGKRRELRLDDLRAWIPRLAALPPSKRAELPGISRSRAHQALAGAIVAEALLTVAGGKVAICPWSTRDGLLLTLQDKAKAAGDHRAA